MRRFFACVLFVLLAFAFTNRAQADTLVADLSGGGISFDGTLTDIYLSPGVYSLTSIVGTFSDSNLGISNAAVTLTPDNGTAFYQCDIYGFCGNFGYLSPDGAEIYDNLIFNPGTPLAFDDFGILFSADGYQVSIANLNGSYNAWVNLLGNPTILDPTDDSVSGVVLNGSVVAAPEPSSLLLLGTGLLLGAGLFRRTRPSSNRVS